MRVNNGTQTVILTVDRNRRNVELLAQFLNQEGYQHLGATSLEECHQALIAPEQFALALLDVSGFNRSIWALCQHLRTQQIPFLIISPRQSTSIQQQSLTHGAHSMLIKPLVIKELLALIHSLLG